MDTTLSSTKTPCCGLVIGKFMPLHLGHVGLIRFALKHCEILTVALIAKPDDPIPVAQRVSWFEKIFGDSLTLRVVDLCQVPLPVTGDHTPEAEVVWTQYFKEYFSETEILFSSESYGDTLAEALGIPHCLYDPKRDAAPVSGAQIRKDPESAKAYLPELVYEDLMQLKK
jgi:HTH-type transcriptional repressor of NAD biosynthesis genes